MDERRSNWPIWRIALAGVLALWFAYLAIIGDNTPLPVYAKGVAAVGFALMFVFGAADRFRNP